MDIINMEAWLTSVLTDLSAVGIIPGLRIVGGALVFAGFVWHIVAFFFWGRGLHPVGNLIRTAVAVALIANTVPISQFFMNTWLASYNGLAKASLTVVQNRLNEFADVVEQEAPNLAGALAITQGMQFTGGLVAGTAVAVGGSERASSVASSLGRFALSNALKGVMRLASGVVSLYFALVVGTGFAIGLAGMFLPLAAACLLLPIGETGLVRWASVVLMAHVGVWVLPILLGSALQFVVVGPLEQIMVELSRVGDAWTTAAASVTDIGVTPFGLPDWQSVGEAAKNGVAFLGTVIGAALDITFGTIVRVLVGLVISAVLVGLAGYYVNAYAGQLLATSVQRGGMVVSVPSLGSGSRASASINSGTSAALGSGSPRVSMTPTTSNQPKPTRSST
jgi:hypothetical protein